MIPTQFPAPTVGRLWQWYGDSSPMGLLWTFMGASTAYTVFAGAGELLGGILLCFRRTTTLGALVVAGVMSNVVMLNFSYDVPVKLGSSHLLLATLVLLAPEARRLADVFLLGRAVPPADLGPVFERRWLRIAAEASRIAVLAFYVGFDGYGSWTYWKESSSGRTPISPNGYYQVAELSSGTPLAPDRELRWKSISIRDGHLRLWPCEGTSQLYRLDGDPASGRFRLLVLDENREPKKGAAPIGPLRLEAKGLTARFSGDFEGHPFESRLLRRERGDYLLVKRGFHWISEVPYNR